MDERIIVQRALKNGRVAWVRPFHVCMEGLESATICRDEEDYDAMVKHIFTCAYKAGVIVVIYAVVSNHAHAVVLGETEQSVRAFSDNLKRVHSMWLHRKYGEFAALQRTDAHISPITTIAYARNALAYVPRNAMDNGADNLATYKWTGFRGMFCGEERAGNGCRRVSELCTREKESIMHTRERLSDVVWELNAEGEIEPGSACDHAYLEMIFNHDQAYFLKCIGSLNES